MDINNKDQMSMLEVATKLMEEKRTKQPIRKLIKEVLEIKGLTDEDNSLAAQLYIDITTSSKFVYMGNEEWDLKIRQKLDEWDKDGSAFNSKEEEFEDDNIIDDEEDFDDEEEDIEIDEEEFDDEEDLEVDDEEDDDDEIEIDIEEEDFDDLDPLDNAVAYEEADFDEDKYNDLMDDYEDIYDEN